MTIETPSHESENPYPFSGRIVARIIESLMSSVDLRWSGYDHAISGLQNHGNLVVTFWHEWVFPLSFTLKQNGFGDSVNNKRFGQKPNKDKPSIPPKPPKSPAIKSSKSETTTDTKKVLSKTTETMKTTTEKRSRTVQFNLDDDHEDKDADSQTNPFATNGKKSKVENSRMRYVYAKNSNVSNSL